MKRIITLLVFVLILLGLACTIPSSVEIKGNPSIKFSTNMDLGEMFTDIMDSFIGESELDILDCINENLEYRTFLIKTDVFDESLDVDFELPPIPEDTTYTITIGGIEYTFDLSEIIDSDDFELTAPDDIDLLDDFTSLPITGFDDLLGDFKFDGLTGKLYISSGSDILEALTIELEFKTESGVSLGQKQKIEGISSQASGLSAFTDDVYPDVHLPDGGIEITNIDELLNGTENIKIHYRIYIEKDSIIQYSWLEDNHHILVEMALWFPMALIADGNKKLGTEDGSEIKIPNLEEAGNLLTSLPSDIIKNISLGIELNENPFTNGYLVVECPVTGLQVRSVSNANTLNLVFTENDIEKFAGVEGFSPEFSVFILKDKRLGIPRDLIIKTVSLNAGFSYIKDF